MEASKYATQAPETTVRKPTSPEGTSSHPDVITSTPVSEAPAPVAVPDMGAFSQTRPPDDLFSDDFTPLAEPVVQPASSSLPSSYGAPVAQPPAQSNQPKPHRKPQTSKNHQNQANNTTATPTSTDETASIVSPTATKSQSQTQPVRGDRSTTGGPAKSKLTEEELNAKMQAMKVKNTELEQAHARSQADEESFRANEAAVKEKQRQDRVNRQAMLSEREKNAQRKIQAQRRRDWDVSKEDSDIVDRPQRRPMRGAHGGIARDPPNGIDSGPNVDGDSSSTAYAYSRGGARGGRGRERGGGRGGRGGDRNVAPAADQQTVPSAGDFPALNNSDATARKIPQSDSMETNIDTSVGEVKPSPSRVDSYGAAVTPAGEKTSWADQMDEASSPAWGGKAVDANAPKGGW